MFWFILTIALSALACFICYKKGKIAGFQEARNSFKNYNIKHPSVQDTLAPGLEAAEHLIDQLEEKESIWE